MAIIGRILFISFIFVGGLIILMPFLESEPTVYSYERQADDYCKIVLSDPSNLCVQWNMNKMFEDEEFRVSSSNTIRTLKSLM